MNSLVAKKLRHTFEELLTW